MKSTNDVARERDQLERCSTGHSGRDVALSALAEALHGRFRKACELDDLKEAIEPHHAALGVQPPRNERPSLSLSELAICLSDEYGNRTEVADSKDSMTLGYAASELRPLGHLDRGTSHHNPPCNFRTRFRKQVDMRDLEEAIELHRAALDLRPSGHPDRFSSLRNLALCLLDRYDKQGLVADSREAAVLNNAARIPPCPTGCPDRDTFLHNLACDLTTRFKKLTDTQGLEEAIELHRAALELRPSGHPRWFSSFQKLSRCLLARYGGLDAVADLKEVVRLGRAALEFYPPGHPDYGTFLHDLACTLRTRFKKQTDTRDLQEATELHHLALELRSSGNSGQEKRQKDLTFKIDDRALECEGFVRRCVFPKRVPTNPKDNSVTLSYTHHCAVIVYANEETGTCFALAVGYCSGYEWLHVIPDTLAQLFFDVRQTAPDPWNSYAQRVYDLAWVVSPKHVPRVAQACTPGISCLYCEENGPRLVQHAHLPKSIRGVQIVYQRLPQPNTCFVTMDITRCMGCCVSPDVWQTLDGLSMNDFDIPCLTLDPTPPNTQVKRNAVHRFLVDGVPTSFLSAVAEPDKIKLGDYGLHTESAFVREGNIFEDESLTTNPSINPKDSKSWYVEHKVCPEDSTTSESNVMESVSHDRRLNQWESLVMWNPKVHSLPIRPHVLSLLKDLSRRLDLKDRWLVTTVVECTACSGAHAQGIIGMPPTWSGSGVFYKRGGHRKTLSTTTPLFISKKPLPWREEKADECTRTLFDDIRMYFPMLLHFHQQSTFEGHTNSASNLTARDQVAVDFFRNIFGGGRFRGYIGDISFSELSRAINDPGTHAKNEEQSAVTIDENLHVASESATVEGCLSDSACNYHTTGNASGSNDEKIETADDARVVALADALMKRMPVTRDGFIDQKLWGEEKIKMYHEAEELRSASFGLQLLYVICTSYHRSSEGSMNNKHGPTRALKISIIRSLIQDVRTLEAKLATVEDEDEKRALEEDIAGKILLACWRGVRSEIEKILSKVANHIITDARVGRDGRKQRFKLLRDVGDVFKHATNDSHGESRGCHLRRIVVDAEENISKYELLLASRATPRIVPKGREKPC